MFELNVPVCVLVLTALAVVCHRKGGFAARLDTGAVISVPPHIKDGMKVSVNIKEETYITRVQ